MNPSSQPPRRAMISVYDKTESFTSFVRELVKRGFEIISSGGTAKHLLNHGIEVTDIKKISGQGDILKHRVVTLVPHVHAGLLANAEMQEELANLGFPKFDLLYVTFYPLADELNRDGSSFESCIELCDIGGPTMVRSAVKGGEVIVMTKESQQAGILQWLDDGEPDRRAMLDGLRGLAEQAVHDYVGLSAKIHEKFHDLRFIDRYGL